MIHGVCAVLGRWGAAGRGQGDISPLRVPFLTRLSDLFPMGGVTREPFVDTPACKNPRNPRHTSNLTAIHQLAARPADDAIRHRIVIPAVIRSAAVARCRHRPCISCTMLNLRSARHNAFYDNRSAALGNLLIHLA